MDVCARVCTHTMCVWRSGVIVHRCVPNNMSHVVCERYSKSRREPTVYTVWRAVRQYARFTRRTQWYRGTEHERRSDEYDRNGRAGARKASIKALWIRESACARERTYRTAAVLEKGWKQKKNLKKKNTRIIRLRRYVRIILTSRAGTSRVRTRHVRTSMYLISSAIDSISVL